MRFLANENFPLPSIRLLRENGHFVRSISEEFAGIQDIAVMEIAQNEGLTILTFDKDYGEIIFRYGVRKPPPVVFLRYKGNGPLSAGSIVLDMLTEGVDFNGSFTVVDENNIRQRKY